MWLLTSIVMFIIAAFVAALDGDYSGIKAIAQFVMYGISIFLVIYLFAAKPALFWLILIVSIIYYSYCIWKQKNK